MSRGTTPKFVCLNINAHPHPRGTYREIIEDAHNVRTRYFGDRHATIDNAFDLKEG